MSLLLLFYASFPLPLTTQPPTHPAYPPSHPPLVPFPLMSHIPFRSLPLPYSLILFLPFMLAFPPSFPRHPQWHLSGGGYPSSVNLRLCGSEHSTLTNTVLITNISLYHTKYSCDLPDLYPNLPPVVKLHLPSHC